MRRLRLALLAAAPTTVALGAAAAGAAPTMIHTSADLGAVLHRPIVVASGEPGCQDALGELGLVQAVQARGEALELLLLSPDSSPELKAKLNLTSCHDLAFIDPEVVGVGIDAQGGVVELAETPTATAAAATAAETGTPIHFAPTSSQELQHFLREVTGGFNVAFANGKAAGVLKSIESICPAAIRPTFKCSRRRLARPIYLQTSPSPSTSTG